MNHRWRRAGLWTACAAAASIVGAYAATSANAAPLPGSTAHAASPGKSGRLNPKVAPGGNFDLSHWELQLPTGTTNNTTTILPSQLEGPHGFQDKYFYTDPTDGSMTFWDPENGVTLGSNYARTELREMDSAGAPAEWDVVGNNTLSATVKVDVVPDHVTVGQIHLDNSAGSSKPLLELFCYKSGEIALFLEQTPAGGNGIAHPITTVKLGSQWTYSIDLNGSHDIAVTINGHTTHFTEPSSFDGYKMYFKAGDYDQSTGSSSKVGARVHFYALSFSHTA
ncbi:MAG TPA: polysaccharide lyase family 7 protein [Actinocrinis sp.]|jgi:hypothetical protein|uniref:polysaccharide lyase family 7 protein n=1 Tax=Actinocrinis sp. TaxID=1920516 RepID=UPI002DDD6839|nr:polysaccharide lyase family 7 protein [Actinocrinis sp.]HEV3171784.1 polysaccharide lyase family 7 protein [Actinocrinis sp.]